MFEDGSTSYQHHFMFCQGSGTSNTCIQCRLLQTLIMCLCFFSVCTSCVGFSSATVVLRDRFSTNQPLGWSCFRHLQDASRVARRGIQGHTSVLLAHVVWWAASYASCSLQVGAVSEGALHVRPFQFLGSISVLPTCVAKLWKPCTCFFAQPASADACWG